MCHTLLITSLGGRILWDRPMACVTCVIHVRFNLTLMILFSMRFLYLSRLFPLYANPYHITVDRRLWISKSSLYGCQYYTRLCNMIPANFHTLGLHLKVNLTKLALWAVNRIWAREKKAEDTTSVPRDSFSLYIALLKRRRILQSCRINCLQLQGRVNWKKFCLCTKREKCLKFDTAEFTMMTGEQQQPCRV